MKLYTYWRSTASYLVRIALNLKGIAYEAVPVDPLARARIRAAALTIATDVHPVNNLRVVAKLKAMDHSQDEATAWANDWMPRGFAAFGRLIDTDTPFCFGDMPGVADLCPVPQLYNAYRGCELSAFTRLTEIEARCLALPAFASARPEAQSYAA